MSQLYVFPYLSVPVLTGYLQKRGIEAHQRDLNLEFLHHAFESGLVARIAERRRSALLADRGEPAIAAEASAELCACFEARFVADHWERIRGDLGQARRLGDLLGQADPRLGRIPAYDEFDRIEALVAGDDPFQDFFEQIVAGDLQAQDYDVIAISCAMGPQLLPSLWLARRFKQRLPKAHIVLGGATINLLDRDSIRPIASLPFIDSVVQFGGPQTLHELILRLQTQSSLSDLPNVFDGRDPARIEMPRTEVLAVVESSDCAFSPAQAASYPYGFEWLPIQLTLGCYWGRCTFCSYVNIADHKYEVLSAERFVDQVEHLVETYGTRRFRFITEALPPRFCEPLLAELQRRDLDIHFSSFVKIDREMTPDRIRRLAAAGMTDVEIGVESLNQRILNRMRKGCSREMILDQLRCWTDAGVRIQLSFIFDFPTTTQAEALQDADDLYAACNDLIDVTVQPFGLIQGTPMADNPERFGIQIIADEKRSASLGHIQSVLLTMPYLDPAGMTRREKEEVLDLHRAHAARIRERRLRASFTEFDPHKLGLRLHWPAITRFLRESTALYEFGGKSWFYHFAAKRAHCVAGPELELLQAASGSHESTMEEFVQRFATARAGPLAPVALQLHEVLERRVFACRLPPTSCLASRNELRTGQQEPERASALRSPQGIGS